MVLIRNSFRGNYQSCLEKLRPKRILPGVEGYKQSTQGLSWGLVPYIQGSPPPVDFVRNMWTGEGSTNKHRLCMYLDMLL
jgi:hypothetical protein